MVREEANEVRLRRCAASTFAEATADKSAGQTSRVSLARLPRRSSRRQARAKSGGVDGTRTRGLRRDRPASITADHSRPWKIGVGCPASWPSDAVRGRVFGIGLQILANDPVVSIPQEFLIRYTPRCPSDPKSTLGKRSRRATASHFEERQRTRDQRIRPPTRSHGVRR